MKRDLMLRKGIFSPVGLRYMRFDKENQDNAHLTKVNMDNATPSMLPKKLSSTFTPFPLPKYDASLGFGPVRLSNIPDVEKSKQRLKAGGPEVVTLSPAEEAEMAFLMDMDIPEAPAHAEEGHEASATQDAPFAPVDAGDDDAMWRGYHVAEEHFPVIDRLLCDRTVEDLLAQWTERPERLARAATLLDFASTVPQRSDAQLERMLYELSSLFSPEGNGLAFFANVVYKYGRPYTVADEVMKSFVVLVDALEDVLVQVQPTRLLSSADLYIQLLHFLALIKILEPNKWYTKNDNSPSNRTDYSHPQGINLTTAHKQTGTYLVDHMIELLLSRGPDGEPNALLCSCTSTQLIDLLSGFAALMPEGRPEGAITRAVLEALDAKWKAHHYVIDSKEELERMERLYFTLAASDVLHDGLLASLLDANADAVAAAKDELLLDRFQQLRLSEALQADAAAHVRGPFFFSAVARDKRTAVKRCAVTMWEASFTTAKASGNEAGVQALVESGMELLLSSPDKEHAALVAQRVGLNGEALKGIPFCQVLAERVEEEAQERDYIQLSHYLQNTQVKLAHGAPQEENSYVRLFKGERVHPIRTFLSSLEYVNDMDHAFLLHSSILERGVDQLISLVHRLHTGKDTLILTTTGLKAMQAKAAYSTSTKQRTACRRALEILTFEMEQGRVVLLTCVDEILLHDAGVYCDEDLMMWSMAAYLAREMPLVKVHALVSPSSPAARPHHLLKGPHATLNRSSDLYNRDMPLLSALRSRELRSVTHLVRMRTRVRDSPNRLYNVNPSRQNFLYRRDKALFDKYHVTARNVAPGFSRGALAEDTRGLGFYTPEHPQVPYTPHPLVKKYLKK